MKRATDLVNEAREKGFCLGKDRDGYYLSCVRNDVHEEVHLLGADLMDVGRWIEQQPAVTA